MNTELKQKIEQAAMDHGQEPLTSGKSFLAGATYALSLLPEEMEKVLQWAIDTGMVTSVYNARGIIYQYDYIMNFEQKK